MQNIQQQLALHYATTRTLIRDYFPRADSGVIEEYVEALRAYEHLPHLEALSRLATAHHRIASSVPTIQLEP